MSFPRYPQYKDSGVEWLGQVPEHWELKPLWTFYRRVKRVGFEGEQLLSVYRDHGVIPKASRDDNFNKPSDDLSVYQLVIPGDLAINKMKAWQGSVAVSEHRGIVSPAYFVYESLHTANSRFLHYLMRSTRYITGYLSVSKGIRINQWDLEPQLHSRMPLVLPPLEDQTRIAEFLDRETAKIDELVAEQERLMALLKEKRQSVISHAVTKGLNPNAPMKPSGIEWLGDVPKHWEEYPLRALLALKHGYAFDSELFADSGEYVLMTPGNFYEWGGFRSKIPEKFYASTDFPKEFILQSGQMLVAMTEQAPGLLGSALFVPDGSTYLHNQRLGRVHSLRSDKMDEKFLYHLFNSSRYRAEVSISSTGAKVKHTSPQRILSVKVFLPPLSEQKQIGSFLDEEIDKTDELEAVAQRAIDLLQERRTALISAAVTGQIDVRHT